MTLPLCLSTPQVLNAIGVSRATWNGLRDQHGIKPVCRGKRGYIYRAADIERIFSQREEEAADDNIMKGLESIG